MNFDLSNRKELLTRIGAALFFVSFFLHWIKVPIVEMMFEVSISQSTSLFNLIMTSSHLTQLDGLFTFIIIILVIMLILSVVLFFKHNIQMIKGSFIILLGLLLLVMFVAIREMSGGFAPVVSPGIGFYLGLISFIILIVSIFAKNESANKQVGSGSPVQMNTQATINPNLEVASTTSSTDQNKSIKICSNCNKANEEHNQFCVHCGLKL